MQHGSIIPLILAACLVPAAGVASADGFRTPSDNIHCIADVWDGTAELRCDIMNNTASVPARPADCDLDWGNAFAVSGAAGRAYRVCAGDTVMDPGHTVLDYGGTWRRHGFTCSSETTGVTCANRHGNGFFLSKKKQTLQ